MHEILIQNVLNTPKYRGSFEILELFVSERNYHEILQMADNRYMGIVWTADNGVHWPITGSLQCLILRLVSCH